MTMRKAIMVAATHTMFSWQQAAVPKQTSRRAAPKLRLRRRFASYRPQSEQSSVASSLQRAGRRRRGCLWKRLLSAHADNCLRDEFEHVGVRRADHGGVPS